MSDIPKPSGHVTSLLLIITFLAGFVNPPVYAESQNPEEIAFDKNVASLQQLISSESFAEADQLLWDVQSHNPLDNGEDKLLGLVAHIRTKDLLTHLDSWVAKDGKSPFPYLIRSLYFQRVAEDVRGSEFFQKVPIGNQLKFSDNEEKAWQDIQQSIAINDGVAAAYYYAFDIAMRAKDNTTQEAVFEKGIKKFPDYPNLYESRLRSLAPKWGGSVNQEIAFAFRYSSGVPKTSYLRILPLSLYSHLTTDFYIDCETHDATAKASCEQGVLSFLESPTMHEKLKDAFGLYNDTDEKYNYNKTIIQSVLGCTCLYDKPPVKNLFSVAYEVLGNENYALNYSYGYYLSYTALPDSVERFKQTLTDIESFHFPSETEKNGMLAATYNQLSDDYNHLRSYQDGLDYANKALALDDKYVNALTQRCNSHEMLKQYELAIEDCSASIKLYDKDFWAWYLKASSFYSLQKYKEAARDYEKAKSLDQGQTKQMKDKLYVFLSSAYYKTDEYQNVIDLYAEIYKKDPDWFKLGHPYAAAAYEALCYAHMGLGDYNAALEDCNKSIAIHDFGPAGHYKEQLLERMHFNKVDQGVKVLDSH